MTSPLHSEPSTLAREGARRLLRDALQLSAGSPFLILYQRELQALADYLRAEAALDGIEVDARSFERGDFAHRYPPAFAPARLAEAVPVPMGIALLIEWSPETTEGRLLFLNALQGANQLWRVASMPGVNLSELPLCAGDMHALSLRCFDIFAVLARANVTMVHTKRPDGSGTDTLVIPISKYCPIVSTGLLSPGDWGNFPSGETFVVPDPMGAHGWITIRGSYPRRALHHAEWVRLEIVRGRIKSASIQASSRELKREFHALFFNRFGRPRYANANAVAELGVGANDSIARLTGNPIFDEKQLGTVHVGVGGNTQFKGPLKAAGHLDLTCTDVVLEAGGVTVVDGGKYVLRSRQALPPIREAACGRSLNGRFRRTELLDYCIDEISETINIAYVPARGPRQQLYIPAAGDLQIVQRVLALAGERGAIEMADLADFDPPDRDAAKAVFGGLVEYGLLVDER